MIKSKIEIAPEEYWVVCTYQEIKLYLFSLSIAGKIDWRLPTNEEQINKRIPIQGKRWTKWWTSADIQDSEWFIKHKRKCVLIPVRDLKDD